MGVRIRKEVRSRPRRLQHPEAHAQELVQMVQQSFDLQYTRSTRVSTNRVFRWVQKYVYSLMSNFEILLEMTGGISCYVAVGGWMNGINPAGVFTVYICGLLIGHVVSAPQVVRSS